MFFVGIIEENSNVVNEITQYFLRLENYSLLFICSSTDEFESLPAGKRNRADLIIIDPGHNGADGLWPVKYIKQQHPEAHILLLSAMTIADYHLDTLKEAGVDSAINKNNIIDELARFFENGINGNQDDHPKAATLSNKIKKRPSPEKNSLTNREFEIIELVAKGFSNKKIGEQLYISQYTVNAHLRKIFIKLSVNSRVALVNHVMNELV